jgi:hypothetical protein
MKALTLILLALTLSPALASAEPRTCDVEQTSDGDYGVRELRASGWVYIKRQLTEDQAYDLYLQLVDQELCR